MASGALYAAGAVLFLLYFVLILIWRIYLDALHGVPGPRSWIVFPILRHISGVRGRLDIDMRRFHAQYGEVVRFGPGEVSFITLDAWKSIYGHGHPQLPKVLISGSTGTDILSADDLNHSRYRKALSPAFSTRGLQAQEPHLIVYVEKLISRLKGIAESRLPVDMVKWYNLTTFDLIGDLAFGQSFGGLDCSEYHYWVSTIFNFVKVVPFLKLKDAYPVVLPLFIALLPKRFLETHKRQTQHAKETVHKRLNNTAAYGRGDFMDSMLRNRGEKDGLSDKELEVNAALLIFAGSETTATLLSGVTYWLLKSPEALAKVTAEVRSTMRTEAEVNMHNVMNQLPYMHACLEETFRLYPPLPSGPQRRAVVPIQISGYNIPPGVSSALRESSPPSVRVANQDHRPSSPFINLQHIGPQPTSMTRNPLSPRDGHRIQRMTHLRHSFLISAMLCSHSQSDHAIALGRTWLMLRFV